MCSWKVEVAVIATMDLETLDLRGDDNWVFAEKDDWYTPGASYSQLVDRSLRGLVAREGVVLVGRR